MMRLDLDLDSTARSLRCLTAPERQTLVGERVALSERRDPHNRGSERARHKERDIASLRGCGAPQTLRMQPQLRETTLPPLVPRLGDKLSSAWGVLGSSKVASRGRSSSAGRTTLVGAVLDTPDGGPRPRAFRCRGCFVNDRSRPHSAHRTFSTRVFLVPLRPHPSLSHAHRAGSRHVEVARCDQRDYLVIQVEGNAARYGPHHREISASSRLRPRLFCRHVATSAQQEGC